MTPDTLLATLNAKELLALLEGGSVSSGGSYGPCQGLHGAPSSRGLGTSDLVLYMSTYLYYVYLEGRRRGYGLNASKTSMVVDHK
jgi:hypothetical protein